MCLARRVFSGMTKDDSKSAGPGINFMAAGEVAEHTLGASSRGEFLVLTHPRTAEYEGSPYPGSRGLDQEYAQSTCAQPRADQFIRRLIVTVGDILPPLFRIVNIRLNVAVRSDLPNNITRCAITSRSRACDFGTVQHHTCSLTTLNQCLTE